MSDESPPADQAIELAERLLVESLDQTGAADARRMKSVADLIEDPTAKTLSMVMTDRLFRSSNPFRAARSWRDLIDRIGIGGSFSWLDRLLLKTGALASRFVPGLVILAVRKRLRSESREVILPAGEPRLTHYLKTRRHGGARVNLNQLGEAVLGEEEAERRLEAALALLARPDVNYVSIKISAIFSQINLVAWEDTLESIKERLRTLYRAALPDGKFVNLDMEEYRDLDLTVTAFCEVLDEPAFREFSAGLVLQAYLPDSIEIHEELTAWAIRRVESGGAPIKIRIVKGANLAMEKVEAEWHGWYQAPHFSKHETDAGLKRMLEFACRPENARAVRIGVGSHNLFDVALALVLRERNEVAEFIEIEMLEGMATPQARAVKDKAGSLLLYAPIVKEEDFGSALAYLIRRLDENTSPGNFLADLFSLRPGSAAWNAQKDRFLAAWEDRYNVPATSHRARLPDRPADRFSNEPDTDWTRAVNREAVIAVATPSEPAPEAGKPEVEAAIQAAADAQSSWAGVSLSDRAGLLRACGAELAATRFESIAVLRQEGKKAIAEADTEISEAIDFASYYAETGSVLPDATTDGPLGTIVVAPPWNFPFAIPCGGILAALMAGNAVIFKPAPEVTRIGWWLVNRLWKAGVPRDALQFVACSDGETGRQLIVDERVDGVILTGAYETARKFQDWRPSLNLFAETSGKNGIVVSALSDRELAARDLARSAFGHSGQKCSAASLGILEAEVYDDPMFRRQLRDAAASLAVGPAGDPKCIVTPLVQVPGKNLLRALTQLDPGEEWLL
ncbi:MAG: bifunctional proline dehydrogenase/L-glutamate gamma-semialdehyde dehydrogenase, partial [Verrucomicrobiales bacterium]|nr:bifunctional proline dehydrogenase/L-glutamate gamma-semialdehyde dehydrogenase [Verrucomicrobiales bacterium]